MKAVIELLEGFVFAFVIGVTLISGVALVAHSLLDKPEHRFDLASPPRHLLCPDALGHCVDAYDIR